MHCDRGPTRLVGAPRSRRDARALGIYDHPEPAGKPILALREHLFQRAYASAAVDGNWRHHCKTPAEKRYPQQLALDDVDLGRKYDLTPLSNYLTPFPR